MKKTLLAVRFILSLAVLALIAQTYRILQIIIHAVTINSFLTVVEAWFFGFHYSSAFGSVDLNGAWPSLLLIVACLLVLKNKNGFTFLE